MSALSSAHAGDTIRLTAGNYGDVKLNGFQYSSQVTITSADPTHAAVINYLAVTGTQNITISNIEIATHSDKLGVYISKDTNLTLDHLNVHGNLNGNPQDDPTGLAMANSTNVTISNSEFHDLEGGIAHSSINGLTITNNNIHDIRVDAIAGGGSSNVTISHNHFSNFFPLPTDHRDAIQFYTAGTSVAQKNITITDNVFDRGTGKVAQGIFMGNESGIAYENVKISGNAIIGGAYNGIYVSKAVGAVVTDNLVVGYKDMTSWIEVKDSTNATLTGNQATAIITSNDTNLVSSGNTLVAQVAVGDDSVLSHWTPGTSAGLPALVSTALPAVVTPVAPLAPAVVVDLTTTKTIAGSGNSDNLVGTAGNDLLDGKGGADTMAGGAGQDTYVVDNVKDVVTELPGGGVDTVISMVKDYTLGANVENLTLGGTFQSGMGNDLNNVITGNKGTSSLLGGKGDDTLVSTGGDDVMWGGAGHDVFKWDALPRGDTQITDFTRGQDMLDLSSLLKGYKGSDPVADHLVKFVVDGANTDLFVASTPTGGAYVHVATIEKTIAAFTMGSDWVFHA